MYVAMQERYLDRGFFINTADKARPTATSPNFELATVSDWNCQLLRYPPQVSQVTYPFNKIPFQYERTCPNVRFAVYKPSAS